MNDFAKESVLTRRETRDLFLYEPSTGWLIRRKTVQHRAKAGMVPGCPSTQGHLQIVVNGCPQLAHRLVWLYHYGYFPKMIDHINRNPADNRIENLREADKKLNAINSGLISTNTSGYKGVHYFRHGPRVKRWRATIINDGKTISLGYHMTKEEAYEARKKAEIKYWGESYG